MARKKNDETGEEKKDTLPAAAPSEEPTPAPAPKVEVAEPPAPPPPERTILVKTAPKEGLFVIIHNGVVIGAPEVDRMLAIRQAQQLAAEGKCDLAHVQIGEV